jgi:hypothetical protein
MISNTCRKNMQVVDSRATVIKRDTWALPDQIMPIGSSNSEAHCRFGDAQEYKWSRQQQRPQQQQPEQEGSNKGVRLGELSKE